jgi:hypothetical protein
MSPSDPGNRVLRSGVTQGARNHASRVHAPDDSKVCPRSALSWMLLLANTPDASRNCSQQPGDPCYSLEKHRVLCSASPQVAVSSIDTNLQVLKSYGTLAQPLVRPQMTPRTAVKTQELVMQSLNSLQRSTYGPANVKFIFILALVLLCATFASAAPSSIASSGIRLKFLNGLSKTGGESGIRTHVRVSPKHAFQACAFSHSAISPAADSLQATTLGSYCTAAPNGSRPASLDSMMRSPVRQVTPAHSSLCNCCAR